MHTGYDNFWMYQNNRHEPVLNISKNDNYSQAILTDCYKQVQNGGHPNHLNSYISPQNNDASSHQNNQHRSLDPNCMWPSSVCSMPLKISNSRNAHAQEAFLAQSNNTHYLSSNSQLQQYSGYKYLKNSNVNVSQMYKNSNDTNNYSNCESSCFARNNGNFKGQTQRIRVKDVFTLNNSTLHYQLLSNGCQQPYPKEQQECTLNCHTVNYTRSCTSDSQSQVINYGKNNVPQPPSTCYGHTTASEEPPQYFHNSSTFYQQNAEYPLESQNQFRRGRPVKQNLQLDTSETNTSVPLLRQLLYSGNSQDPKGQIERNHSDSVYGNTSIKIIQQKHSVPINNKEMTNNSGCAGPLELSTGLVHKTSNLNNVTQIQHQENFTRINVACLPTSSSAAALNSNSVKNITSNGGGHSYEQISGQEHTIVKISYPQNFQSTSLNPNDFNNTDINSDLTLPFLLESNDKFYSTLKKNSAINNDNENRENEITNLPQTCQANFSNTRALASVSSSPVLAQNCKEPPRKRLYPKEPFINLNKENIASFLNLNQTCENTSENKSAMNGNENEIIPKEIRMLSNILTLKQENYESIETPSTTSRIPQEKVLFEVIKTEEIKVDENPGDSTLQKYEAPPPEKPGGTMESVVVDVSEDTYCTKVDVDELVLASRKSQLPSSEMEDCQGLDNCNNNNNNNNNNSLTEKKTEADIETTEVIDPMKNYKSKINRDKLDMLIQFLEADELNETKLKPPCKKKLRSNKERKKGVDLNHNRRKLNKTHIVKNKNNSREMISYKIARVELTKCSSEPSQILKVNSSKIEERKCSNAEGKLRNVSLTEQAWEISSKPSPERNSKIQDEENFLRTMRALQNLKTHFCVGCGLVSPIDSFWINVASGELRCFNCFSKVAVKGRQNAFKSKPDGSSNFEGKSIQKCRAEGCENIERFEGVTQNNVKVVDKSNNLHEVENADVKSINPIKETVRHEVVQEELQIDGENTGKKGIDSSHTFGKQRVSPEKRRDWEDREKLTAKHPGKINKSKEASVTHKAKHPEDTPTVEVREKKCADYSSQHRKRSDPKDNKFLEEHAKREEKRVNSSSDKSVKKTKEGHFIHKENSEAQIIKKNPKCEQTEKSKTRSPSVESDPCQKPKPVEQTKSKELNSLEESKRKSFFGLNGTEKHKRPDTMRLRKRKNSEEDVGLNKIRILEDNTGKEKMQIKTTNVSKEDSADSKSKISESERRKNSVERSWKSSSSKEGDHSKKETKQVLDSSDNSKMKDVLKGNATYQKMKAQEQARQKSSEMPRRNSKDEQSLSMFDKQRGRRTSKEGANSPIFTIQETGKRGTKYGSYAVENNGKKKTEEKDKKHPSEKTQKSWSLEKDNGEKVITSIENAVHPASKPLKEGGNKDGSGTPRVKLDNKVIKTESHLEKKEVLKQAEGKRDEKNMKEKEMINSDKKKYWELIERMEKCDQNQVENRDANKKTVAFERKNKTDVKRSLLQELIKKTKKLSWYLK